MTQVDSTVQQGSLIPRFESYYFKYGDTLYQEYKIIYLVVAKDDQHDCERNSRESNWKGIRGQAR